jgi:hypothetical protein
MVEGITFECSNTLEFETLPCLEFQGNSNSTPEDAAPQLFHAQHLDMAKKRAMTVVQSGRLGGAKGGPARAANMTPEERSASASVAAQARWAKNEEPVSPELKAKRLRARLWARKMRVQMAEARLAAGLPPKKVGRPKVMTTARAERQRLTSAARYAARRR